ncbi:erythromycin esterase family protein [Nocardia vaccinii]|uniref:erythromycin esterase family protein n=1 Tax=Nocardia vaccinii TaxID=1822 RepID=UPI00083194E8|nr:erythromycin esterase family protein [Nocardia vaccinii]
MSIPAALHTIGRPLDDPPSLGRVLDELLSARAEPPAIFALGEPVHGIAAFPLLRNDILAHLVDRGYRSIALETDALAASMVEDYVNGANIDIDTVLATGFSHGFGGIPGNRELLHWLRAHNGTREAPDRVRFHGFDAPVEFSAAPSPRRALCVVRDHLPEALWPVSVQRLDELAGEDADWSDEAAMFDPAASVGDSVRARALRVVADDLVSALRRAAPSLRAADPRHHQRVVAHARAALGLLRYHAVMATPAPDRIANLGSMRAEMMAENLVAILAEEHRRGPSLVFAHNAHLQRARSLMSPEGAGVGWGSAGALVGSVLGDRYLVVTTDAARPGEPDTLQGVLAEAATRRTLFPAPALRAALPDPLAATEPLVPGHIPLRPDDIESADAVLLLADTGEEQYRYW